MAKTKKEQGTTVQPIRQPMTIDNSGHNLSALPLTPAPVEANHGGSNVTKDVHKPLLVPVSAAKVHNQKPAPRGQATAKVHNQKPAPRDQDIVSVIVLFQEQQRQFVDIVSVIVLFQEQQRQFVVIHKLPALPTTPIDT
uniref:Uncharacterized protein n=1 Tax=Oryza rufipogon TaxID=4529 RepID=A0A0E0PKY6_ORYRU